MLFANKGQRLTGGARYFEESPAIGTTHLRFADLSLACWAVIRERRATATVGTEVRGALNEVPALDTRFFVTGHISYPPTERGVQFPLMIAKPEG